MSHATPRSFFSFTQPRKLLLPVAAVLVALGLLTVAWAGRSLPPVKAAPADCSSGNVPSFIETDSTFSGDLYVTDNVTIRSSATVTFTAGTQVTMCGAYQWWVQDARLLALGTSAEPVIFAAQDPATPWERIYMGGGGIIVQESVLRHVVLEDGGGTDDTAETGSLHIYAPGGTVGAGPVVDHVTVRNSGSYGIYVRVDEADGDPLSLTNLTVTGSARAPLMLYVSAMRGLGDGHTFTGNTENVVEVRAGTVLGGSVRFDQRWLAHDVPYRVVGGLSITGDNDPILTIDPGATLLMDEGADISVQSGGLVAEGRAAAPITFTRLDETSLPWDRIYIDDRFSASESRLSHVQVLHAGHTAGAILVHEGSLSIANATIAHSSGPGVSVINGALGITDSTIEGNQIGVEFRVGSHGVLRRNTLRNNVNGAVVNDDSRGTCVDAIGNYWGSADGPVDGSGALDDCNLTATNAGGGNAVSDNVLYEPWLTGPPGGPQEDTSSISPDPFWVVADGVDSATVTVTVRDGAGNPLAGKEVVLQTTRGIIQQPAAPSDENGVVTAVMTSTETGNAMVTARNVTDGEPLAALASIRFWRGLGDTAGLIPPGGVPYAAHQVELDGQPFEQGFPMTFRLPMQNGNPVAASVVVTYAVSNLGIGPGFQPVEVVSKTLQPAEAWDAEAVWYPPSTGHRCVRAMMAVTLAGDVALAPAATVDVGPIQVNFDVPKDPCKKIDPDKLIPNSAGLSGVRKHVIRGVVQAYLTNECIKSHLGGGSAGFSAALASNGRAYEEIVTPPAYSPSPMEPGNGVTQEQANAANAMVGAAYRLAALDEARLVTAERIRAAGQAGDDQAAARQRDAYERFHRQYAQELLALADAIVDLLALTEGAGEPDTFFYPSDYEAYLQQLKSEGYDAETQAFHQAAGLPPEAIEVMLQAEIARLEGQPLVTTSFYRFLDVLGGAARRLAQALQNQYGSEGLRAAPLQTGAGDDRLQATFVVGNPTDTAATVDLLVRPVDVPLDWSYSLDDPAPSLDPGATTTVTLSIDPAGGQATGRTVQLAVEGFIGDEYVGGVLLERAAPAVQYGVYLPAVSSH